MNKLLVSAALLSMTSFSVFAENETETTVTYNVEKGFAETLSISQTEQLGNFRVVLKSIDGPRKHKRKLVLEGVFRGILNPDFTLNHTFVNEDRTGALYTAYDTITNVFAGDPTCQNGTGTVPFEVEETLYIVAGTGVYAGVQPGSFIVVEGVVNNCPSLPEFGQNNFDVISGTLTITQ